MSQQVSSLISSFVEVLVLLVFQVAIVFLIVTLEIIVSVVPPLFVVVDAVAAVVVTKFFVVASVPYFLYILKESCSSIPFQHHGRFKRIIVKIDVVVCRFIRRHPITIPIGTLIRGTIVSTISL